jgi:tetratricopeptide (TPR) repeat protein
MRSRYPDGQLFINLRGYGPGQPMAPAEALARLLRGCGLADEQIPADEEERAAALRSTLAGRRMLLLLDNAGAAAQVRPLLPGTGASTALVTSRDTLAGLVARDGAVRLGLDLLPVDDALRLLHALIGRRAVEEPEAMARLAHYCARLPLALRVAAELAVSRPESTIHELVTELSEARTLTVLDSAVDERTAVTNVFSWSYHHLDPPVARAFRLLADHPGPEVDSAAAAAMLDERAGEAARLIALLRRAHLLQPVGPDRYAVHDLLRIYAAEIAVEHRDQERAAALSRLVDHYLAHASYAAKLLYPGGEHGAAPPTEATSAPIQRALPDAQEALVWLDAHRSALVAAAAVAGTAGRPDYPIMLGSALRQYLDSAGRHVEALAVHELALAAARRTGARSAEALALMCIGNLHWRRADYQAAAHYLELSYDLACELGELGSQARVLNNLGGVAAEQGHWDQAAQRCGRAVQLQRRSGDVHNEAITEANLGLIYMNLNQLQPAITHSMRALRLSRRLGERYGEANALTYLGLLRARQGREDLALKYEQQALQLYRGIGHRLGEAGALRNLGDLHRRRGRSDVAIDHQQQALAIFRDSGDPGGEVRALNGLADALRGAGRLAASRDAYTDALLIAARTGSHQELARAHDGLGRILDGIGDHAAARKHWQTALELFADLHLPEADDVRSRLASSPSGRT